MTSYVLKPGLFRHEQCELLHAGRRFIAADANVVFTTTPNRDGDLDAEVFLHE